MAASAQRYPRDILLETDAEYQRLQSNTPSTKQNFKTLRNSLPEFRRPVRRNQAQENEALLQG